MCAGLSAPPLDKDRFSGDRSDCLCLLVVVVLLMVVSSTTPPPITILTPSSTSAAFEDSDDEEDDEEGEEISSAAVLNVRLTAPARWASSTYPAAVSESPYLDTKVFFAASAPSESFC